MSSTVNVWGVLAVNMGPGVYGVYLLVYKVLTYSRTLLTANSARNTLPHRSSNGNHAQTLTLTLTLTLTPTLTLT
eukprot:1387459-Amorphochlora_amoeboformis.AAC.1